MAETKESAEATAVTLQPLDVALEPLDAPDAVSPAASSSATTLQAQPIIVRIRQPSNSAEVRLTLSPETVAKCRVLRVALGATYKKSDGSAVSWSHHDNTNQREFTFECELNIESTTDDRSKHIAESITDGLAQHIANYIQSITTYEPTHKSFLLCSAAEITAIQLQQRQTYLAAFHIALLVGNLEWQSYAIGDLLELGASSGVDAATINACLLSNSYKFMKHLDSFDCLNEWAPTIRHRNIASQLLAMGHAPDVPLLLLSRRVQSADLHRVDMTDEQERATFLHHPWPFSFPHSPITRHASDYREEKYCTAIPIELKEGMRPSWVAKSAAREAEAMRAAEATRAAASAPNRPKRNDADDGEDQQQQQHASLVELAEKVAVEEKLKPQDDGSAPPPTAVSPPQAAATAIEPFELQNVSDDEEPELDYTNHGANKKRFRLERRDWRTGMAEKRMFPPADRQPHYSWHAVVQPEWKGVLAPSVAQFEQGLYEEQHLLRGLFAHVRQHARPGEGVILAGGAVVRYVTLRTIPTADADLFVYAPTDGQRKRLARIVMEHIDGHQRKLYPHAHVFWTVRDTVATHHVWGDGKRLSCIQLICSDHHTPFRIVSTFDVDYVRCFYDGTDVWATAECLYALRVGICHQFNETSGKRVYRTIEKGFGFANDPPLRAFKPVVPVAPLGQQPAAWLAAIAKHYKHVQTLIDVERQLSLLIAGNKLAAAHRLYANYYRHDCGGHVTLSLDTAHQLLLGDSLQIWHVEDYFSADRQKDRERQFEPDGPRQQEAAKKPTRNEKLGDERPMLLLNGVSVETAARAIGATQFTLGKQTAHALTHEDGIIREGFDRVTVRLIPFSPAVAWRTPIMEASRLAGDAAGNDARNLIGSLSYDSHCHRSVICDVASAISARLAGLIEKDGSFLMCRKEGSQSGNDDQMAEEATSNLKELISLKEFINGMRAQGLNINEKKVASEEEGSHNTAPIDDDGARKDKDCKHCDEPTELEQKSRARNARKKKYEDLEDYAVRAATKRRQRIKASSGKWISKSVQYAHEHADMARLNLFGTCGMYSEGALVQYDVRFSAIREVVVESTDGTVRMVSRELLPTLTRAMRYN